MNRAQRRAAERERRKVAPRVHVAGLEAVEPEVEPAVEAVRTYLNRQGMPHEDVSDLVLLARADGSIRLLPRHELAGDLFAVGDSELARELEAPVPQGSIVVIVMAPGGLYQTARARWVDLPRAINAVGGAA
jgi:hypothetical protein